MLGLSRGAADGDFLTKPDFELPENQVLTKVLLLTAFSYYKTSFGPNRVEADLEVSGEFNFSQIY